jgi:chaperonin GroES
MKIKPLADRVLVRPEVEKGKRKGGIVIPDTAQEKPQVGKVIAVGAGRLSDNGTRISPSLKKGDRILFEKYSGAEVDIVDIQHLIVRESDVIAIVQD